MRTPRQDAFETQLLTGAHAPAALREIRLAPLSPAELRQYVSSVHGIEASLRLAERLRAASGGVPARVDRLIAGMTPVREARARALPGERARFDEDVPDAAFRIARDPAPAAAPTPLPAAWSVLTVRQREVAVLAARDLSNAEIADALGITARAVAFHMSNVPARLGLASRRELS